MKKSGKSYIITIIVKALPRESTMFSTFYIIYFPHCWINMNANNIEVTFCFKVLLYWMMYFIKSRRNIKISVDLRGMESLVSSVIK